MADKAALKAGLGYTIGNFMVKGINFITLPLFSRLLSTDEFGVYNVFLSYDAILYVIIGFSMSISVKSAHYKFKNTDEYVSSISIVYVLSAILFLIVFVLCRTYLSSLMGISIIELLFLVPFSFGSAVIQLYNERISLNYEYKKFLLVGLLNSVGNIVISLLLILSFFRNQKDLGRIVGSSVTILIIAFVILYKIYKKAFPRYNKQYWKFGLRYSLPIVPHGISQVLLAQCDRIMISKMVSDASAGIYSLAGNLKLILTVITTSIGASWSTWFYSKMDKGETEDIQKNSKLLLQLFLIITIGLMSFSSEIIQVLGGQEYDSAKLVAIPMIMDAFILFLYNIIVPSEYYTQKTHYIMIGTLVSAVINLLANYVFIKSFGFVAAAYTTLFSYMCYLIIHIFISKRLVKFSVVKWNWIVISILTVAVIGAIDLVFMDYIVLRYSICAIIVAMLCPSLLSFYFSSIKKKA